MGEADDWAARIAAHVVAAAAAVVSRWSRRGRERGDGSRCGENPSMEVISDDGQEAAGRSQSATGVESPIKKRTLVRWAFNLGPGLPTYRCCCCLSTCIIRPPHSWCSSVGAGPSASKPLNLKSYISPPLHRHLHKTPSAPPVLRHRHRAATLRRQASMAAYEGCGHVSYYVLYRMKAYRMSPAMPFILCPCVPRKRGWRVDEPGPTGFKS
jgi:hypothetical protein